MATRLVKLRGPAYWAKVFESNRDLTGYDNALADIGGQTTIDIDLEDKYMNLLHKSRSMLRGSESKDNPGMTRVKFKRKWQENYGGGEPKIERPDGTPWDIEQDGLIGNGSMVEVTVSVYDTSRKNIVGTRLDKVKVLKHEQFGGTVEVLSLDDDEDEPQEVAVKKEEFSDEIPF
jgi:hypothetical protein